MATRITETYSNTSNHASGSKNNVPYDSESYVESKTFTKTSTKTKLAINERVNWSGLVGGLAKFMTGIIGSSFALFFLLLFLRKGLGLPYLSIPTILNMYNNKLAVLGGTFNGGIVAPSDSFSFFQIFASIQRGLSFMDGFINTAETWLRNNPTWVTNVVNLLLGPIIFLVQMMSHLVRIVVSIFSVITIVVNNITALVSTAIDVITYNPPESDLVRQGSEIYIWSLLTGA